ncbi:MAG: outer membrane lipoprotein-sorting protein [Gammaproteobacteria bacterium]
MKYSLVILTLLFSSIVVAEQLTADEIVYQSEEKYNGDTEISDSTMILIDPDGNQRVRKMKAFRKDFGNDLKDEKSVYFFSYPNDIKDTSYLNFDWIEDGKDDDSWLFLPSLKKIERLAAADKSDAFLGSDFSYTDIKTYQRQYWDYSIINESDTVDGAECWVLEGLPKRGREDNVVRETGYYKVNLWIRKDNFMSVKGIFWVDKGKKVKYFKAYDIENINGIWTAKANQMVTTKQGRIEHSTVIKLDNVRYNEEIDDTFFTPQRMTRGM